ncbi:hypothetical protein ABGB16_02275 [Micromonospora sp. B11E3]|uniref:hypothetical protein n=1 Tax=Micromonospora sp. B11E3 TaxID=3153562 RepID=UPI00325E40C9
MSVYQSKSRLRKRDEAEAEAAHEMLATHVPDQETGLCGVCLDPGPCRPANAAANRLVELGRPVLPADQPKPKPVGLRAWLRPHRRAMPKPAPLLTFVWLSRLPVPGPRPRTAQVTS